MALTPPATTSVEKPVCSSALRHLIINVSVAATSKALAILAFSFGKFINGVEQSANRPVTYIRASGGIPSATVRAFRKGLVQIFGDIDYFESHPV